MSDFIVNAFFNDFGRVMASVLATFCVLIHIKNIPISYNFALIFVCYIWIAKSIPKWIQATAGAQIACSPQKRAWEPEDPQKPCKMQLSKIIKIFKNHCFLYVNRGFEGPKLEPKSFKHRFKKVLKTR